MIDYSDEYEEYIRTLLEEGIRKEKLRTDAYRKGYSDGQRKLKEQLFGEFMLTKDPKVLISRLADILRKVE